MSEWPSIILASASKWRLKLLHDVGILAVGQAAEIDEYTICGEGPIDTALKRSAAKALHVASMHSSALVIGADQVVYLGAQLFEKPKTVQEWRERLLFLRGQKHQLSTAVTLVFDGQHTQFVQTTEIYFRADISEHEIDAYIEHGEAWGCAGGYMMEGHGAWLIEKIEGDWQNVIGLPIFPLISRLKHLGYGYTVHSKERV